VLPHKHATKQRYATQSEAVPNTPNPHTGRETGLDNLSRGLGKTAHRGPASGTRRDVRARPTQGRVAPAKGNSKLPERPRDEGGPREARPASLHCLVGQVPEQRQGRGPKAPKEIDRQKKTTRVNYRFAERDGRKGPPAGNKARCKQPQPRAGRDRASESGQRHASRRTRPTDTGTRCPGKGQR
jgi:hypothetical protein